MKRNSKFDKLYHSLIMEYKNDATVMLYSSMTDEEILKDFDSTVKMVSEGIADWMNWRIVLLDKIKAAIVSRIKTSMEAFVDYANKFRLWLVDKFGPENGYNLNLITHGEFVEMTNSVEDGGKGPTDSYVSTSIREVNDPKKGVTYVVDTRKLCEKAGLDVSITVESKNWFVKLFGAILVVILSLVTAITFIISKVADFLHYLSTGATKWASGLVKEDFDGGVGSGCACLALRAPSGKENVVYIKDDVNSSECRGALSWLFDSMFDFFKMIFGK